MNEEEEEEEEEEDLKSMKNQARFIPDWVNNLIIVFKFN